MAEMLSRIRKGNVQLRKVEQEKPKPAGEQGIMQEMASILVGGEGIEERKEEEGVEEGKGEWRGRVPQVLCWSRWLVSN